tara:strand:- start:1063 stop:1449 length:387 start_codon:yes stop_codon:yes gene_type:complete
MDFPAIMQDGRLYTDYKSSCIMNGPSLGMTSFEYRNYLTRNADKIIKNNTKIVNEMAECGQCSDYSVFPPYETLNCNTDKCIQNIQNYDGLGLEIEKQLNENKQKKLDNIQSELLSNTNNSQDFTFQY